MSQEKLKPTEWVDAYERGARHVLNYLRWRRDHVADGCNDGLENHERADYVLTLTKEINVLINGLTEDGIIH